MVSRKILQNSGDLQRDLYKRPAKGAEVKPKSLDKRSLDAAQRYYDQICSLEIDFDRLAPTAQGILHAILDGKGAATVSSIAEIIGNPDVNSTRGQINRAIEHVLANAGVVEPKLQKTKRS